MHDYISLLVLMFLIGAIELWGKGWKLFGSCYRTEKVENE